MSLRRMLRLAMKKKTFLIDRFKDSSKRELSWLCILHYALSMGTRKLLKTLYNYYRHLKIDISII